MSWGLRASFGSSTAAGHAWFPRAIEAFGLACHCNLKCACCPRDRARCQRVNSLRLRSRNSMRERCKESRLRKTMKCMKNESTSLASTIVREADQESRGEPRSADRWPRLLRAKRRCELLMECSLPHLFLRCQFLLRECDCVECVLQTGSGENRSGVMCHSPLRMIDDVARADLLHAIR